MFGIYIHVPFCTHKCFYCDFYSVETLNLFGRYIDALCLEMELRAKNTKYKYQPVDTIFLGGGTPSLLYPEQLEKILTSLRKYFEIKPNAEITLEANPGTLDIEFMKKYNKLGVNRLSIGIQSFNDNELKYLERIHNSKQAEEAISTAREAGFEDISTDIIFSIPGQDIPKITNTIETVLKHRPNHVSAYSLIYEPGTPLYDKYITGEVDKIDDDLDADIYEYICNSLIDAGYEQYEISNFALPGFECKHNLNYWNRGNYISFGPSAHSYIDKERFWNVKSLDLYYQYVKTDRLPAIGTEQLGREELINESIMLGLRAKGLNVEAFKKEFDIDLKFIAGDIFYDWEYEGLCSLIGSTVKLNHKGYFISDTLSKQLIRHVKKYL